MALNHPQGVAGHVFTGDIPCVAITAPGAAHTNPFALTQGIKTQAHMFAEHASAGLSYRAGAMSQVARQKLPERPFANKTDTSGVFLRGIGETDPTGDLPNNRFRQMTHRKKSSSELGLVQPVEKITLVLRGIQSPQKLPSV